MKFLTFLKSIPWVKLSETAISILCILLLLLPHSTSFYPGDLPGVEIWTDDYLWEDDVMILIYVPFVLLWIAYLRWKDLNATKIMLVLFSIFHCGIAWLLGSMPMQDLVPHVGAGIPILIFPFLMIVVLNGKIKYPLGEEEIEEPE